MNKNKSSFFNFTSTLGRVVLLGLIILFLVNIIRSIYKNHNVKNEISQLETEVNELKNEKLNLQNRILYYQTDTYKELEARKHLNYKKIGENVVVLANAISSESKDMQDDVKHNSQTQSNSVDNSIPNWQKWMKYIFG